MKQIAAVILTKNEENMIADCIDSVRFCDEVVVVDSNSKDNTAELARRMGAEVFSHDTADFSEKRNFAKSKVKAKWILYVDADERVSPELAKEIRGSIDSRDAKAYYFLRRQNYYLGDHPWPYIEKMPRLFQRAHLVGWHGVLHETPEVEGESGVLKHMLLHYTHRDLTSMVDKTNLWSEKEAQLRMSAHHPAMTWWRFFRVMGTAFYDSYVRQQGYKARTIGLIESFYQSFSMFITYAKLWELQKKKKG